MERRKRGINLLEDEICTRQQFIDSYQMKGQAQSFAAMLDRHEIFPLTFRNPKLTFLNTLGLHVYFSGALTKYKGSQYDASICGGRKQQRDLSETVESELGMKLRRRRNDLEFGENGGTYARLLSLMGFFTSKGSSDSIERKARIGSELPAYLSNLIEHFDELTLASKGTCRKFVRDLVSVCFDTKGYARNRNSRFQELVIEMLTQPTPELVEKQGRQIVSALNIVYPKIGITQDQIHVSELKYSSDKRYEGAIVIPLEQAILFPNYANSMSPIEIVVNMRPCTYSFDTSCFGGRK